MACGEGSDTAWAGIDVESSEARYEGHVGGEAVVLWAIGDACGFVGHGVKMHNGEFWSLHPVAVERFEDIRSIIKIIEGFQGMCCTKVDWLFWLLLSGVVDLDAFWN